MATRADEIAGPLGLEFYIGMPATVDRGRLATTVVFGAREALTGSRNRRLNLAVR